MNKAITDDGNKLYIMGTDFDAVVFDEDNLWHVRVCQEGYRYFDNDVFMRPVSAKAVAETKEETAEMLWDIALYDVVWQINEAYNNEQYDNYEDLLWEYADVFRVGQWWLEDLCTDTRHNEEEVFGHVLALL